MRAGRNSTAFSSANTASNEIESMRNGSDKSHTSGHSTSAASASGQHDDEQQTPGDDG